MIDNPGHLATWLPGGVVYSAPGVLASGALEAETFAYREDECFSVFGLRPKQRPGPARHLKPLALALQSRADGLAPS